MKKRNLVLAAAMLLSLQTLAQTPVCNYICNEGFDNTTPSISTVSLLNSQQIPCWKTTSADGLIEIWGTGYNGVPAYSGSQFLEINATQSCTIYQDFTVNPGTNLAIGFAHRGRAGVDVMKAEIGPVGGPYTLLGNYSDGTSWNHYTATYTVPASSGTNYTIRFTSVSWAGGNPKIGNFLDDVTICGTGGNTPPPSDPPVNLCEPCRETDVKLESFEVIEYNGITDLALHINSGNRVIQKVRITLLNYNVTLSDRSCADYCNMESRDFGHFIGALQPISGYPTTFAPYNPNILTPGFTNQIELASSSPRVLDDLMQLRLKFPPVKNIPGCSQTIEACFRVELIDDNCVVCERMVCTVQAQEPKSMKADDGTTGARSPKVYPNPNNGSFTISTQEIGAGCRYQLTTLDGKEVKSGRMEGGLLELTNGDLANGTYTLYIFNGNETFVEKIVVMKN